MSLRKKCSLFFHTLLSRFVKHDLLTLAAALAFYTVLSLAPILVLTLMLMEFLGSGSKLQFISQIQSFMGHAAGEAVQAILKNASQKAHTENWTQIFGIGTLFFSASVVFAQLHTSLNIIWEHQSATAHAGWLRYLRKRFFSMLMVVVFSFFSIASLVANTILTAVFPKNSLFWYILNEVLTLVVFTYLFSLIFRYLPDSRTPWPRSLAGAFFTAILFTVGKSVISVYLGTVAISSAYGAAGSLVVLLMWVYYSSLIVFIGAEVTRALPERLFFRSPG